MDQVVDHRTRPFYWIDKCIPTQYARLIKAQGISLYNALARHVSQTQKKSSRQAETSSQLVHNVNGNVPRVTTFDFGYVGCADAG